MDYWVQDTRVVIFGAGTSSMEYWVQEVRAMYLGTGHYSDEVLGTRH